MNGSLKHSSTATVFLHPHPGSEDAGSCVLFILSDYPEGLERAARLFPFRTGVPVPSWIVLSSAIDTFGIGGVVGAGYEPHSDRVSLSLTLEQQSMVFRLGP